MRGVDHESSVELGVRLFGLCAGIMAVVEFGSVERLFQI